MAKIRYKSELEIILSATVKVWGASRDLEQVINIPVHSFEVTGGTNRKINLASADEVSVALEFEQARTFKNLVFYIPPTKDFLALKLIELANQQGREFGFNFFVSVYSGTKLTRSYGISAGSAYFLGTPSPIGDTPPLLRAKVKINSFGLFYGKADKKSGVVYLEEI
jgi:hypothetical protein